MKTIKWNEIATQLIAASGVMLILMQTGLADGWISPNMARLTAPNATLYLTLSEASWLASSLKLGKIASVILVPIFIESLGSKNAILCSFFPIGIGWVLTMTAKSAVELYIARFLAGMSACLAISCYPIFLGEISTPSYRGTFLTIASIGWSLGTVLSAIAETYVREAMSCTLYLVPCILGMFLFNWLPNSPYHLVKNQRTNEASESLAWYRGHDKVEAEMNEIIEYVKSSGTVSLMERMRQLPSPSVRKAILLILLINELPQLSGVVNVFYYRQIILDNSKSYLVDPSQITIYTNVILLVFIVLSVNVLDKFGRRVTLIASCALMTMALLSLGIHFYLLNNLKVNPVSIQWLPIASIVIILVAFTAGYTSAMNVLLGELFPAGVKSTVAMVAALASALSGFISTKSYQPLVDAMGESYLFWTYAGLMALSIPVFLAFLPETKGKSLQEIQKFVIKE